ncbi:divergent polysaccharide deacetylase family protein [Neokomagataea anthophila]|uniref:Divergent polysaccharide deacetylase family protein n=1 Tax=Neokomagataea anthophila TaxID=2826925 RepID=A0ABS5E5H0_9PROT|nr:divergent polysaccharide deacetylase family protein [Neokomagataea anthophila]MBR0559154.1 divergent polysaccharide deacetylase family protein [Neokomagataea anthophila]
MGKMLVLFWGGVTLISGALALTIHYMPTTPPVARAPVYHHPSSTGTAPSSVHTHEPEHPTALPQAPTPSLLEKAKLEQRIPLAIFLAGYGYGAQLSQEALQTLPSEVGLGISPYLEPLSKAIAPARAAQHEVYMSLPMRSSDPDHTDTGSRTLGTGESPAHEQQKLSWWLSRSQGITGMTDITGSGCNQTDNSYLQSQEFHDIAQTITRHGLLYLNEQATSDRPTRGITATQCINGDTAPEDFTQSLKTLIPSTPLHGAIILVITPITPAALHSLIAWLHSATAQHFYLMPLSALADTPPPLSTH